MNRDVAIQKLQDDFYLNRILAFGILHRTKKRSITNSDLEKLFLNYMQQKVQPFVKWVGGKRQLLKQFREQNLFSKKYYFNYGK